MYRIMAIWYYSSKDYIYIYGISVFAKVFYRIFDNWCGDLVYNLPARSIYATAQSFSLLDYITEAFLSNRSVSCSFFFIPAQ